MDDNKILLSLLLASPTIHAFGSVLQRIIIIIIVVVVVVTHTLPCGVSGRQWRYAALWRPETASHRI